jgi:hypothetical protein
VRPVRAQPDHATHQAHPRRRELEGLDVGCGDEGAGTLAQATVEEAGRRAEVRMRVEVHHLGARGGDAALGRGLQPVAQHVVVRLADDDERARRAVLAARRYRRRREDDRKRGDRSDRPAVQGVVQAGSEVHPQVLSCPVVYVCVDSSTATQSI